MPAKHTLSELGVGLFVLTGIAAIAYLSVTLGGLQLIPKERYPVRARFASIGDLKQGAPVKLSGVKIGEVSEIKLQNYVAAVRLAIDSSLKLPSDTIASIRTEGLLGQDYVMLTPGSSRENLQPEGLIAQTEPALDLIQLLVKYGLEQGGDAAETPKKKGGDKSAPEKLLPDF